jgi:hypothetical protein
MRTVGLMTITEEFFTRYADALLARDEKAVAALYAVPGLILFPGQSIAVTDPHQTEEFFASSWAQYEGVREAHPAITVMGEGPASIWADVTWSFDGQERERFCYQLVPGPSGHQIAVLTLLA